MRAYCKMKLHMIESLLSKALLDNEESKEKKKPFSFLELPPSFVENSWDLKPDLIISCQLIQLSDDLEQNEEYWKKMLDPGKTGKS